jgi:hypothetical protein
VSLDRLGLALQLQRLNPLCFDRVADEPQRLLPEKNLARLRCLFEPGGDVDCVTGREPLLRAGDDRC